MNGGEGMPKKEEGTAKKLTLKTDPRNARLHPPRNLEAVKRSLDELGAGRSIVVDRSGLAIGGSAVLEKAVELGLDMEFIHTKGDKLVVVVRDDLATDDPRRKALALADNQIALLAEWDLPALEEIKFEIKESDFDIDLDVMGFEELDKPIKEPIDPGELIDRAGELQKKWKVKRGQVWEIPSKTVPCKVHRVMYGDSTDERDVERLIGEKKIEAVVTDPPYEMAVEDVHKALSLFANRAVVLTGTKQAFGLPSAEWRYRLDFVWRHRRPNSVPTRYRPLFYHNNIVMLTKGDVKLGWARPFPGFGSVIEIEGVEYENTVMGHGKSPQLFVEMVRGFEWTVWADPFAGTASTLLACEQLKRICYCMEREPRWVAVALERADKNEMTPVRHLSM